MTEKEKRIAHAKKEQARYTRFKRERAAREKARNYCHCGKMRQHFHDDELLKNQPCCGEMECCPVHYMTCEKCQAAMPSY